MRIKAIIPVVVVASGAVVVSGGLPAVAAGIPGGSSLIRDGITLDYRRLPVTVPASTRGVSARSDYDGDLKDDLAIGSDDGVIVRYSAAGHIDQMATVLPDGGCSCFGQAMTSGDFDGDGYDDLVVADPVERDLAAGHVEAGAVWIFPGGPDGLRIEQARHLTQSTAGVPGASEQLDQFGGSLAAGDLTGDRRDDLAIGIPGEGLGPASGAGGVIVLKGSASGITTAGAQWIDQGTAGVPGSPEAWDAFGWSVAIGRINTDGYADLAIGTPYEYVASSLGTGMITQFWGSAGGVSLARVTSVNGAQITSAVNVDNTFLWNLGMSLGITDTNGDGYGEVASGNGYAQISGRSSAGSVVSLAGRSTGLSAAGVKVLSQDSAGVPGAAEDYDYFGQVIAVGDVTGDGRGDVLAGVPGEDIGSAADAGAIVLLRGSASGLTGTGSQMLDQNSSLVPGVAERGDRFGFSVTLLNLNGTGSLEAVVGAPEEEVAGDVPGFPSGSVTTFPGGSTGLRAGTTTSGRAVVTSEESMARLGMWLARVTG